MSNTAATPDPRADEMRDNPQAYFRAACVRARAEVEAATRRERELARRRRPRWLWWIDRSRLWRPL